MTPLSPEDCKCKCVTHHQHNIGEMIQLCYRHSDAHISDLESRLQSAEAENVKLATESAFFESEFRHELEKNQRIEAELARTRQELAEAKEQIERRIRKPCYANREGVKCLAEVFYLCFHCKQWFCDTHGLFHFGMEPEHGDKRPTTCLLEKVEALQRQLAQKDKALEKLENRVTAVIYYLNDVTWREAKRYLQEGIDEIHLAEIAQIESNSTLGEQ